MNDIKRLILPEATKNNPINTDTDRVTLQSDHGRQIESGFNHADEVYW